MSSSQGIPATVLIVSKEEALQSFESRICEAEGFQAIQARWGDQAFQLYKDRRPIAAVITDLLYDWSDWRLAMRGDGRSVKNGIQLAVAIRKLDRKQRIVIQTYTAMDHVRKHLTGELVGVRMLRKPFRPEQLVWLLKEPPIRQVGWGWQPGNPC